MLPIILVSENKKDSEIFLKDFCEENKIRKNHIYKIFPLKKEILISQIRELKREVMIDAPFSRLFIFYEFDRATQEAQNALLKTFEETVDKNQFILITNNEHLIIPTVRSRSKIIKLYNQKEITTKNNTLQSAFFKNIETSANYRFLGDKILTALEKDEVLEFLNRLIFHYKSKLSLDPESAKIIKKILHLKTLIKDNNLDAKFALDYLLIFINKVFKMKE